MRLSSVSVIIPARNAAATLARTLASLAAQQHDHFDVIVVDDASTDGTAEVARSMPAPRVQLVAGPGRGPGAARNAGARAATGAFIAFLDADDEAMPDWLGTLTRHASDHIDVVTCGLHADVTDGSRHVRDEVHLPVVLPDFPGIAMQAFAGTLLIRTSLFATVGGYDEELHYSENTELSWRLLQALGPRAPQAVCSVPEALIRYHLVANRNVTRGYRSKQLDALRLIERKHGAFLDERRHTGATYAALHGVLAAREGAWDEARSAFAKATTRAPARARNWIRRAIAHIPPVARRIWPPRNDGADPGGAQ